MSWPSRVALVVLFVWQTGMPLGAVTRVANTHPGPMLRLPSSTIVRAPYLFSTGFGSEIHRFSGPFNASRGFYFWLDPTERLTFGFSSVQGADTTDFDALGEGEESAFSPSVEFGFHFRYRVYVYNDISFSMGLHDIVFERQTEGGLSLDPDQLSVFAVIGSDKEIGEYRLNTYMGFGSGGFASMASSDTADTASGGGMGVFAGFLMKTPFMAKWGGLDFVGEFDGTGLNVGLRIPLTSDYRLSLGFTHIENLPAFAEAYATDHPGLVVGLDLSIPRGARREGAAAGEGPSPVPMAVGQERVLIDSAMAAADLAVGTLRDSLSIALAEARNLATQVASLQHKSRTLEDSLRAVSLQRAAAQNNLNRAMRHLSSSLRYFYSGDYREALQEVETSLDLDPNLALAYARRGSIYYKLGDVQRATINWNLALQIDPEYDDVRNILKALHENRLKTAAISGEE